MEISPDQIELAERLNNLRLKNIVTYFFFAIIFIILIVFIILCFYPGKVPEKVILGCLEGVMGYTAGPLAKHFFPALSKTIGKTGKTSAGKKTS